MAGKEKETVKKVQKLSLNKMVEATGENYPVIVGALVNGGFQDKVENRETKAFISKTDLKKLITDFKNKEV
jgi:rRNA pseudouridine-1189 N-methylase Emg1 (Nep1/Mra1 family)